MSFRATSPSSRFPIADPVGERLILKLILASTDTGKNVLVGEARQGVLWGALGNGFFQPECAAELLSRFPGIQVFDAVGYHIENGLVRRKHLRPLSLEVLAIEHVLPGIK